MNTTNKHCSRPLWFTAILLTAFLTGCGNSNDANLAALTVTSTNPAVDATAATNHKITATFSEPMDAATLDGNSFTVKSAEAVSADIIGTVTLDVASNTAIFSHDGLNSGIDYTATITTAAASSTGKTMAENYAWNFTGDAAGADIDAPTISSTNPANGATDFPLNRNVTASFSESLDPSTVNTTSFTLEVNSSGAAVTGVVSYSDTSDVAIFNPKDTLTADVIYKATLSTQIKDLAGIALATEVWTFSGKEIITGLMPVDLGTAGDFAILAKTGISKTDTAGTMITGDIGVSPEALSAITRFSVTLDASNEFATSAFVTGDSVSPGRIYAANMTPPTPAKMTAAIGDMQLAFTDAAGRTLPDFTELGAGNITGKTLAPGLYKWGTEVLINAAGVTISGSDTDVWIFQIAKDLIVANDASVTLAGGALAKNIFWQVSGGTGVAIGTDAVFNGVVLAQKGITVNTRATVNGRLLAQTAVTLDANPVTQP